MAEATTKKTVVRKKRVVKKAAPTPTKEVTKPTAEPRSEVATEDLSALQLQLEEIDLKRQELERRIQNTRRAELRTFCSDLLKEVKQKGHDADDVIAELTRRRGRSVARTKSTGRRSLKLKVMVYNDDPSLTYVRGVTPDWMRKAMADHNLDHTSASDRRLFRAEYMHEAETDDSALQETNETS